MDAEFIENLPKIREMFKEVKNGMLGTERLKPNETVVNNNRERIILDVDNIGAARALGIPPNDDEVDLYARVLSGAPFIIKVLLEYSEELEVRISEMDEYNGRLEDELTGANRTINELAHRYGHSFI